MQSEASSSVSGGGGRAAHKVPDWEMAVETELVRRNMEESLKGEPRPMVPPIHTSATFLMRDSKEGEVLSGNKAKVAGCILASLPWSPGR